MQEIIKPRVVPRLNDTFMYSTCFLPLIDSTIIVMRITNNPQNLIENCLPEQRRKWDNYKSHQTCRGSKSSSSKTQSTHSLPAVRLSNGVMLSRTHPPPSYSQSDILDSILKSRIRQTFSNQTKQISNSQSKDSPNYVKSPSRLFKNKTSNKSSSIKPFTSNNVRGYYLKIQQRDSWRGDGGLMSMQRIDTD